MSTLNVTNISDGTDTTATANVVNGSAKAWVNFDGTTNTGGNCDITGSYNVSSVGDNGVGLYTVNFSNNLTDANYSPVLSMGINTGTGANRISNVLDGTTASGFDMRVQQTGTTTERDEDLVTVVVFR